MSQLMMTNNLQAQHHQYHRHHHYEVGQQQQQQQQLYQEQQEQLPHRFYDRYLRDDADCVLERASSPAFSVASSTTSSPDYHGHEPASPRMGRRQYQYSSTAAQLHTHGGVSHQRRRRMFADKMVFDLCCAHCETRVCRRAMKALLLADTSTELYSTDAAPDHRCSPVGRFYSTPSCECKITDVGCRCCGNVLGYHVVEPCQSCLKACNNGHLWMFHGDTVISTQRTDPRSGETITWGHIPAPAQDMDGLCSHSSQSNHIEESAAQPVISCFR